MNSDPVGGCETISIISGKGGSGKTFIAASLAYTLQHAGQRVCLIDTDFATQGLSLFVLGPGGSAGRSKLNEEHSLYHMVEGWTQTGGRLPVPKLVHRLDRSTPAGSSTRPSVDEYHLIVSNRQFYDRRLAFGNQGDEAQARELLRESMAETTDRFRGQYRDLIPALIGSLSGSGDFDYVLIDTRGGFSELSLVPPVFSDSFLVVAEPDFTSFHQLAKLLTNVDLMAREVDRVPYIRGVLVNKATDGTEEKFRALLDSQFGVAFDLSWPIPLDSEAIAAYKRQQVPYVAAPSSSYAYHSLTAFTEMFDIVTAEWSRDSKLLWHGLAASVNKAYGDRRTREEESSTKQKRMTIRISELEQEQIHAAADQQRLESELQAATQDLDKAERASADRVGPARTTLAYVLSSIVTAGAVVIVFLFFQGREAEARANSLLDEVVRLEQVRDSVVSAYQRLLILDSLEASTGQRGRRP